MIVIGDTSPLTNLAAIEQFDLLRQLFGHIHIPDGVWAEHGFWRLPEKRTPQSDGGPHSLRAADHDHPTVPTDPACWTGSSSSFRLDVHP